MIVYKTVLRKYLTKDGATPDMTTTAKPTKALKKETKTEESSQESESAPVAKKETAKSTPSKSEGEKELPAELGYDDIMQELIARTEGTMFKSILKKNTIVDSLKDDVLTLIIINEQYYGTMQKPETTATLQKTISEIVGKPTSLKRVYMSKEDRLQRALV